MTAPSSPEQLDDLALGYVLDTLDEPERARAERLATRDAAFDDAVARARADVGSIARGIELVADGALKTGARARPPRRLVSSLLAVAAALVLVAGGVVVARSLGSDAIRPAPDPGLGADIVGRGELGTLVDSSVAIVTGRVVTVDTGATEGEDGSPYAIATVEIDETIAGQVGSTIAALDYVTGGTSISSGGGGPAAFPSVGDRVLLFLSDSTGTIHEHIEPSPHYQVTHSSAGRFLIDSAGELIDAPFTLEQVRAAAR